MLYSTVQTAYRGWQYLLYSTVAVAFCTWRMRRVLFANAHSALSHCQCEHSQAARPGLPAPAAPVATTEVHRMVVDCRPQQRHSLRAVLSTAALGQSADCAAATTPTRPSAKSAAAALPRNGRCVHAMDRTGGTRQDRTGGVLVCTQVPKMGPIPGMVIGTKEVEMESKERFGLS